MKFIVYQVLQVIQQNGITNAQLLWMLCLYLSTIKNYESFPLSVVNLIFKNIIKWTSCYYKDAFRWHLITMQGNLFYQLEYLGLIAFIYVLCLYHHNKQPILYVHFTFFFPLNPKRYSGFFSKFWQCFLIVREIFLCFYTSLVEECFDLSRSLIAFYGMVPLCN